MPSILGNKTKIWLKCALVGNMTRAHQEMRYPNVTWRIIIILSVYLLTFIAYHWTINRTIHPLPEHSSTAYLLRIMDVGLPKAPCDLCGLLSTFRVSTINYYLVCRLPFIKHTLYLAQFLCYWQRKTPMTLKFGFLIRQGHWKLHQWIPNLSFPISH